MRQTSKQRVTGFFAALVVFILSFYCPPAFADLTSQYLSSIATSSAPIRIAADAGGILYISAPGEGKIFKFFRDGAPAGVLTLSGKPLSVAADAAGRVYTGDLADGSVRVLSPDGSVLFSLGQGRGEFRMPGGIAVSSAGIIYVTDSRTNMVKSYNPDGTFRSSFGGYGTGPGQMIFPTGICVDDANNEVYVVDQTNGRVEVFDTAGVFKRSFGSYGGGQGQLTRGQGISVAGGRVYVADAYLSTVEVFDTAGAFVAFIGSYGSDPGGLKIPMDGAVIGTNLYVANSDNRRIEVFNVVDPQGLSVSPVHLSLTAYAGTNPQPLAVNVTPAVAGSTVSWTATISAPFALTLGAASGTAPSEVEVGADVSGLAPGTYNGAVVFHGGGNDYPVSVSLTVVQPPTALVVSPTSVSLTYHNGVPGSQTISVGSSGGAVSWSASADVPWLSLSPASGTSPANITASVNPAVAEALDDGVYPGTITVTAPNASGSPQTVPVTLTVQRQSLIVSPAGISLFHQKDGALASDNISIGSIGGILDWTAGADAPWLTLEPSYGTTGASVTLSLNAAVDALDEGVHNASVTVTAPDAMNSPVTVPVTVTVVNAGTVAVHSNLESTSFAASGTTASGDSVTLHGEGTDWSTDEAKPATYTIHFDFIHGYRRPPDQTFTVVSGGTVSLDVLYRPLPVADVIAAAKGPDAMNDATVRVLGLDGGLISEFVALDEYYGANVAMGDIDGDGADEIAVVPGRGPANQAYVKVFRYDGTPVTATAPVAGTVYGANVAMGDIDGDGKAEIALSMADQDGTQNVFVYAFDGASLVQKAKISLGITAVTAADTESTRLSKTNRRASVYPAAVAFGDIDGDGRLELICAYSATMTAYAFDAGLTTVRVAVSAPDLAFLDGSKDLPRLAAGDTGDDGTDEVLVGYDDGRDSMVQELGADLMTLGFRLTAFDDGMSSPSVSAMDCDGDGKAEILVGEGARNTSGGLLRIYDTLGEELKEMNAFDARDGVNAAFGAVGTGGNHAQ